MSSPRRVWYVNLRGEVWSSDGPGPRPRWYENRPLVVGLLAGAVGLAALLLVLLLPAGHWPRPLAALLLLGLGAGLAWRQGGRARWGWLAGGSVLSACTWAFVPATGGLSLWSAWHESARRERELA